MWVLADFYRTRKIINLHPALPNGPKGTYKEVIRQLIRNDASETGIMVHLVTEELDRGPSLAFCRYSIRGPAFDERWDERTYPRRRKRHRPDATNREEDNTLFEVIRREGVKREPPLLVRTIKSLAEGRVRIHNDAAFDQMARRSLTAAT